VQVLSVLIDISSSCFLKKYGEFIAKENLWYSVGEHRELLLSH
jgi:hypothetical protein